MKLENETPLAVAALPGCDAAGFETMTAIIQAGFRLAGPRTLELLAEQPPVDPGEEWTGVPFKPGTDVLVLGTAAAPRGQSPRSVQVRLEVGGIRKRVKTRPGTPLSDFGVLAREAKPRRGFAGTFDERWKRERSPLLPEDFDERYYQAAFPDLVASPHLTGHELLRAENVSALGPLELRLPGIHIEVEMWNGLREDRGPAPLDTLLLVPQEERLTLLWRRRLRCPDGIQELRGFRVTQSSGG